MTWSFHQGRIFLNLRILNDFPRIADDFKKISTVLSAHSRIYIEFNGFSCNSKDFFLNFL